MLRSGVQRSATDMHGCKEVCDALTVFERRFGSLEDITESEVIFLSVPHYFSTVNESTHIKIFKQHVKYRCIFSFVFECLFS